MKLSVNGNLLCQDIRQLGFYKHGKTFKTEIQGSAIKHLREIRNVA